MSLPAATRLPQVTHRRGLRRLRRPSCNEVKCAAADSNHMRRHYRAPPHTGCCRCAHLMVPISGKPEIGCGGPGIHNHGPRVMDSELAIFGGAGEY